MPILEGTHLATATIMPHDFALNSVENFAKVHRSMKHTRASSRNCAPTLTAVLTALLPAQKTKTFPLFKQFLSSLKSFGQDGQTFWFVERSPQTDLGHIYRLLRQNCSYITMPRTGLVRKLKFPVTVSFVFNSNCSKIFGSN